MRPHKPPIIVVGLVLSLAFTAFGQTALEAVRSAERRENLRICLSGRYPILCKHELLDGTERAQANAAERRENLRICLSGLYPSLCNRELLNSTEGPQAASVERQSVPPVPVSSPVPVPAVGGQPWRGTYYGRSNLPLPAVGGLSWNGSYYGQPNVNGIPKTIHVDGYFRRDGTFVRVYYRSPPNTNPPKVTVRRR